MKVIPKYTKEGVRFEDLRAGEAFWWVDSLLLKIEFDENEEEPINAVSLDKGWRFCMEEDRLVRRADVKVVEQDYIKV